MQKPSCTYFHQGVTTRLACLGSGILRVTRTRRDAFMQTVSPAVVLTEPAMGRVHETEDTLTFTAGTVTAEVCKASGSLRLLDPDGQVLLREPEKRPCLLVEKPVMLHRYERDGQATERQSVDGVRASAQAAGVYQDRVGYECRQQFVFDADEGLYGLGSHEEGYGNLRGRTQALYQHNMKATVPVLVSTKGYGLLFDMGCLMTFHDDAQGSFLWADCTDELDWYFLYDDGSNAGVMRQLRRLTGETPLLPRYALGYIQSKERYVDAQEMLAVADEYRRLQVPLDVLVLDWQSWPEGQWGWKHFDETRFPDPAAFIRQLHARDVKLMLSIWPSMSGDQNEDRQEMLAHGFLLGDRLNYDAFDPAARALYWKQADAALFSKGVDACWCDCSEPFESDWHGAMKPESHLRTQQNTDEAKKYMDPTRISLYSLYHSRGIWEGQRSVTREKRVCNLTRSSWTGQHRYAAITWSGDVSATWETLRRHIPEGLNFMAAGEPYWTTDVGGFFPNGNREPWFYDGDFNKGVDDLGYREIFVRWMQYAAFLPMMRAHGTGTPREIWRFGEKGGMFYDAIEQAIRLRYRLLPLLYSLMAQTHRTGLPMLQIPALAFPRDPALRRVDDQMLLGDMMLIKPVTRPMYYLPESTPLQADRRENVLLPAGHRWYSPDGSQVWQGGDTATVDAPLDVIPLFLRSGSILPLGAVVQSTGESAAQPLEIIVYPGEDGAFTLYDDAGDGYGYEHGEYALIPMTWNDAARTLTLHARQGAYPGMPKSRMLHLRMAGGGEAELLWQGEELRIRL